MQTTQNITLKRMLAAVAERQASDLLLVVGNKPTIRTSNGLTPLAEEEVITHAFLSGIIEEIATDDQKQHLADHKEVIFAYEFIDQARFRVDITMQRGVYSMVLHYLPPIIKRLSDLGFPQEVVDLTQVKHGLILVGGAQGSGKTTTLAAFIETINHTEGRHIVTLEQPIEYSLVSYKSVIEQQEVGNDVPDWESALAIQEQSVDMLVVGKLDSVTALRRVLEIANSGVLVCMVVDATSTDQMFESLVHMFPPAEQTHYAELLADVYRGSVIQALVPKVGGGVVMALEVAVATPPLKASIAERRFDQIPNILQTSRIEGMILLNRYLVELVKSGQVDKKQALAASPHTQSLEQMLGK